jgi:4-alpha-glucanotransferase
MGLWNVLGRKRAALVLLHPSSLPDPKGAAYGIGELGSEAFHFVDFLAETGVLVWQILPLGHTGYRDSPYQTFSRRAGSPYLISVERLRRAGDISGPEHEDYVNRARDSGAAPGAGANYGWLFRNKLGKDGRDANAVLRRAFRRFGHRPKRDGRRAAFAEFCEREADWLDGYAEFMGIKEQFGHRAWSRWPRPFREFREWRGRRKSLLAHSTALADAIAYYRYLQFVFFQQWGALRAHAARRGRKILGDIPWYVGYDSADVWANRDLFDLDERGRPSGVAGVPPDYFSPTGQLWGNPLYNWENPRTEEWWVETAALLLRQVDVLRIDHFRAADSYWEIPFHWARTRKSAARGAWARGPGRALLSALRARLAAAKGAPRNAPLPIVAEDLGFLDPLRATPRDYPKRTERGKRFPVEAHFRRMLRDRDATLGPGLDPRTGEYSTRRGVDALLEEFDLAWMAVLQFAFEGDPRHRPARVPPNSVLYTGTHDNDTALGWYLDMVAGENAEALDSMGNPVLGASNFDRYMRRFPRAEKRRRRCVSWDMIEAALASRSCLAGAPMQDLLALGAEARMNLPGNVARPWWAWRATREQMRAESTARRLRLLTRRYGRYA